MNKLTLFLTIISIWLQYDLWFGKNGVYDYVQAKKDIVSQKNINFCLKIRNDHIFAEINDLYNGYESIEERARNDLGMIKPTEFYYRIIKENSNYLDNDIIKNK